MVAHKAGRDVRSLLEEKEPFLQDSLGLDASTNDLESNSATHRAYRLYQTIPDILTPIIWLTIVLVLLMVNIWLWISLQRQNLILKSNETSKAHLFEAPYSPAHEAISYKIEPVHQYDTDDPLTGPPGPQFDQAWSNLLAPFNIYVTAEEMRKANRQSFKIVNEDDSSEERYLGFLEIFHQLHCIKNMVQSQYPELYPQKMAEGLLSKKHFNHCAQVLRRAIMCYGDVTLGTSEWKSNRKSHNELVSNDNDTQPLILKVGSPHIGGVDSDTTRKCIDWAHFDTWVRDRLIPPGHEVWGPATPGYIGPE